MLLTKSELERGQQLSGLAHHLAARPRPARSTRSARPRPTCAAAQAALQASQLNLDYTEVRAPVAGRVGRLEITVGNLVAAGPGAPVLTTLVSVDPIYASFNADEEVVTRALQQSRRLGMAHAQVERIPVRDEHGRPATARRSTAACS